MDMEQAWGVLYNRMLKLRKIVEGDSREEFYSDELVDTYSIVYDLNRVSVFSRELYDRYNRWLEEYLFEILPDLINKDGELMLRELVKRWENYNVLVTTLSDWFNILDRYFVILNYLAPLRKIGLLCFRDHVYDKIKANAKTAVLSLIHNEREGEQIDRSLLKKVLNIFVEIGMDDGLDLYKNDFEVHLFEETLHYYSRRAALLISVDPFPESMRKFEDCMKREEDRVDHYLHSSSKEKLVEIVQIELLSNFPKQLIENELSGFPALLREDKKHDLSRMYRLFCDIPNHLTFYCFPTISSIFLQQLITEGIMVIEKAKADAAGHNAEGRHKGGMKHYDFVRKVIELHDRYTGYVEDEFQNDSIFSDALNQGFGVICGNKIGDSTFAEILAIFCDNLLNKAAGRNGAKLSTGDIETMLETVLKLSVWIDDKDVFGEVYWKKFAFRLLVHETTNPSIEENMIQKLKQQNAKKFTWKMDGIIKDLLVSNEGKAKLNDYIQSSGIDLGIELRVKVLTTGYWPTLQSSQPNLSSHIAKSVQAFEAYYSTKHNNRNLTWIYSLGTCNINGWFDNMKVEMTVTTYQALILLLFNDQQKLSYAEIKSKLNLTDEDVAKQLHSLACSKYKILLKQPETKIVAVTDTFEVNVGFTNKSKRIRLPYPPLKEGIEEKKKVIGHVEERRKFCINAIIVRIMKSRKVLHRSHLISECFDQLRDIKLFKPDVTVIEGQIGYLISQDYLEPDKESPLRLKYVP